MGSYTAFRRLPDDTVEVRSRVEDGGRVGHGLEHVAPGESFAGVSYADLAGAGSGTIEWHKGVARIAAPADPHGQPEG